MDLVRLRRGQEEACEGARAGAGRRRCCSRSSWGSCRRWCTSRSRPIPSASCVGGDADAFAEALAYLRVCAALAPDDDLARRQRHLPRPRARRRRCSSASTFTALNAALVHEVFIFTAGMGAAGGARHHARADDGAAPAAHHAAPPRARRRAAPPPSAAASSSSSGRRLGLAALRGALLKYTEAGGLVLVRALGKIAAFAVRSMREARAARSRPRRPRLILFQLGVATTQL